jgi:hypothetical protein
MWHMWGRTECIEGFDEASERKTLREILVPRRE